MAAVDWALKYLELGYCVIPCIPPTKDEEGKDQKRPRINWEEFQGRKPTKEEVEVWFKKWPNSRIGLVTGAISDLFVVDCDTEEAHQKMEQEYLPDSFLTPKAKSPHGYHYYFQNEKDLRNATKIAGMGLDTRGEGGFIMAPPSRGLNGDSYAWIKGLEPWTVECAPMPQALSSLLINFLNKHIASYQGVTTKTTTDHIDHINFTKGSRDESLFHIANHLVKGGMPEQEIQQILMLIGQKVCEPPFPEKEILNKIQSAFNRSNRVERNIMAEVREWVLTTSGHFLTTELQHETTMTTRQEKKAAIMALLRLEKEGLVIKHGTKRGCYRRVEKDYDEFNAEDMELEDPLEIHLPFELESYVEILPKDLIVIAGTPNAGKTALMLNMVYENMDKWNCHYFSTEMSRPACKRRMVRKDPPPVGGKWKFKFAENFANFEDIIKPDDLNFLDYVEQNEGEAFKIPGILAKIQRKLRNGVAIVALQKNEGVPWAIGGQQTKAKPSLFLTTETDYPGNIMRVIKAKHFKDFNPNGFCMKYKIINGINLYQQTSWGPE
jgi:hypothetical protein